MATEGWAAGDISGALGVDLRTVTRWCEDVRLPGEQRQGRKAQSQTERGVETIDLYVGHLDADVTEEGLTDVVQSLTNVEVQHVTMPRDHTTGARRGFAFITVPTDQSEWIRDRLDGHLLGFNNIIVRDAHPQAEKPRRPRRTTGAQGMAIVCVQPDDVYEIVRLCSQARLENDGQGVAIEKLVATIEPMFDQMIRSMINS